MRMTLGTIKELEFQLKLKDSHPCIVQLAAMGKLEVVAQIVIAVAAEKQQQ